MGPIERVELKCMHYHIKNRYLLGSFYMTQRVQRGNIGKWERVGAGQEVQARGDMRMLMIDSHCCMENDNTYYKAIILQLKINLGNIKKNICKPNSDFLHKHTYTHSQIHTQSSLLY